MAGCKTRTGAGYSLPVITHRCVLYLLLHYAHTPQQTRRRESEREKRKAPSQNQYFAESHEGHCPISSVHNFFKNIVRYSTFNTHCIHS